MGENQENTVKPPEEEGRERTYQRVRPEGRGRKASEEDGVRRGSEEKMSEEMSGERREDELPRESQSSDRNSTSKSDTSNLDTLEPATAHRDRTNAFTIGNSGISISSKPRKAGVGRRGEVERLTRNRQSLTYSSSWNQDLEEQSDEIWRTLGVVTETIGYMLWRSPDYNNKPPWKVCIENGS